MATHNKLWRLGSRLVISAFCGTLSRRRSRCRVGFKKPSILGQDKYQVIIEGHWVKIVQPVLINYGCQSLYPLLLEVDEGG